MTNEISQTPDYRNFIRSLKQKVQSAQSKAARTVNTQLIELHWEIGKLITEKQQTAGWGDAVIDQVAQDLTRELGDIKGFSRANLYRMKKLYEFYGDDENVAQAVRQIPWGHNIEIFQKIKEPGKALWYVHKTLENGWSRNVLTLQIESQLFERQAGKTGIDNFSERLPVPDSDLTRFMLKLGKGFRRLGLQHRSAFLPSEAALVRGHRAEKQPPSSQATMDGVLHTKM